VAGDLGSARGYCGNAASVLVEAREGSLASCLGAHSAKMLVTTVRRGMGCLFLPAVPSGRDHADRDLPERGAGLLRANREWRAVALAS
jgi:hypothetical protein